MEREKKAKNDCTKYWGKVKNSKMSLEYFIHEFLRDPINNSLASTNLGRVALFCNQTSYSHIHKKYLFEILEKAGNLSLLLLPEHGLFAELQDQIGLSDTTLYQDYCSAEVISLYQEKEEALYPTANKLQSIDSLIIDIQDIGSRYYTFATSLSYIFSVLARHKIEIKVFVIERRNPAGNYVEGTPLTKEYKSFVGHVDLPHRHGLTIGELSKFYQEHTPGSYDLTVVYDPKKDYVFQKTENSFDFTFKTTEICPSPNMPNSLSPLFYPGQCLWEGTNVSEGRGTTRPFEIFGAPFFPKGKEAPVQKGVHLRRLRFIPTFHKFQNIHCEGFQIHWEEGNSYHSLGHSLKLLRWIQEEAPDHFSWHEGVYEFYSQKKAIEILAGDGDILAYLEGKRDFAYIRQKFQASEKKWVEDVSSYLIHSRRLQSTELDSAEDFG